MQYPYSKTQLYSNPNLTINLLKKKYRFNNKLIQGKILFKQDHMFKLLKKKQKKKNKMIILLEVRDRKYQKLMELRLILSFYMKK